MRLQHRLGTQAKSCPGRLVMLGHHRVTFLANERRCACTMRNLFSARATAKMGPNTHHRKTTARRDGGALASDVPNYCFWNWILDVDRCCFNEGAANQYIDLDRLCSNQSLCRARLRVRLTMSVCSSAPFPAANKRAQTSYLSMRIGHEVM